MAYRGVTGTVCESVGSAYEGSNPSPPHHEIGPLTSMNRSRSRSSSVWLSTVVTDLLRAVTSNTRQGCPASSRLCHVSDLGTPVSGALRQWIVGSNRYDAYVTEVDLIKQALQKLGSHDAVVGVVVFGSLARGELADTSDIDVLVVHQASVSVSDLRAAVRQSLANEPRLRQLDDVKPIFFTQKALLEEMDRHPSFAAHLADEGLVLYRAAEFKPVDRILSSPPITRKALHDELVVRLRQLRLFSDLDRFNGEFVPCLAQLYSIGRSVVIVKLLENDIREYSWRRVFDAYSEVRPELDTDLNRMATLRAYYEHVRNRSELPSERRNVDSRYVDRAIDSIEAVAAS